MATFNVPAEGWNKLDAQQQEQIREILRTNNLLNEGDNIAGDTSLQMVSEGAEANNACTTACDIAEQAAKAACSLLPWPANKVCDFAADKAGDFCRSKC